MAGLGEFLHRRADQVSDPYAGDDGGATLLILILLVLFLPFVVYWKLLKLPWRASLLAGAFLCIAGLTLRELVRSETLQILALGFGVLAGGALVSFNLMRGLYAWFAGRTGQA